ncbi:hypothetical protein POX_a01494 [Penicillium oxalicum]|uniref:hypothetical protein n=1 Tax=Penicillium oxalicum TaxID=69781 RepID=UPI0020B7E1E6|nr:hypothetical protein POX_a01494 [Penicillium oxalicum]KAI2794893.1 hypothetical protein POX_a01494 [Penicillium oxalicum]
MTSLVNSLEVEIKEKNPELVNDNTIILWLLSNVLAGSDSTAFSIYHVRSHLI